MQAYAVVFHVASVYLRKKRKSTGKKRKSIGKDKKDRKKRKGHPCMQ